MKRSICFLALALASGVAMGQMNVTTTGSATLNGSPFGNGQMNPGDLLTLSGAPSSLNAMPVTSGAFGGNRLVLQFSSFGTGNVSLPTDHFGNTSSGAAGGSASYFTAWDTSVLGGAAQSFNASINSDPNTDTTLNMDEQVAPGVTGTQAGGTFTHDYLPSQVSQTDTFNLNFNMPSYSFSRPLVTFNDGSSIVSPYGELASSGVWVVLGSSTNNFQYIFQGPYGTSDPTAMMFNAGDPIENQIVGPWSNTDTIDFSGVAPGTYSLTYYAISWDTYGLPDNTLSGYTSGNFQQSDAGTITVAPEPAPVVALGLGLILLIRRYPKVRQCAAVRPR